MNSNTELIQALRAKVAKEDWKRMAKNSDHTPEELEELVLESLSKVDVNTIDSSNVVVSESEPMAANGCVSKDFEVGLEGVATIGGKITICGTSFSDWSIKIYMYIKVGGAILWEGHLELDSDHMKHCIEIDLLLLKAEFCWEVRITETQICLTLSGSLCAWLWSWHCAKFNPSFCIDKPWAMA